MQEIQSIKNIINKNLMNLNCQETEGFSNTVVTNAYDLESYTIKCEERPSPIKCEYCNSDLEYRGLKHPFEKNVITRWLKPADCTCEESIKQRKLELERKQEEERKRIKEQEILKKQQKIDSLFDMSKLGERFKKRTFDTFKVDNINKIAFEKSKSFVENFENVKEEGYGIIFSGNCGSGKTHLACSIAIELIKKGTPVIYGTALTLLGKLKETYSNNKSENEILDLYANVDLLIIDDLGKEKPSEWVVEKIYYIINQRYENLKPTIITSNYDLNTIQERLTVNNNYSTAEAIISRLNEMCVGLNMNFDDYRRKI